MARTMSHNIQTKVYISLTQQHKLGTGIHKYIYNDNLHRNIYGIY